jgi:hypothetical protein
MNPHDPNRRIDHPSTGEPRREPTHHPDPTHQRPPTDNQRETGTELADADEQNERVTRSKLAGDEDVPGPTDI